MKEESIEKLNEIFMMIFELSSESEIIALEQENHEKWDSMAHMTLVAALESEFGINLDAGDMMQMTSYLATRELLQTKGM